MTDKEALIRMLERLGVTPRIEAVTVYDYGGFEKITVTAGDSEHVLGYSDFVVIFYFKPDGSIEKMGIWE